MADADGTSSTPVRKRPLGVSSSSDNQAVALEQNREVDASKRAAEGVHGLAALLRAYAAHTNCLGLHRLPPPEVNVHLRGPRGVASNRVYSRV